MAYTAMPWSRTRWAATSSCVDSGLDAHSTTSAPPALSVTARLAVSEVTCRHAAMRRPLSGCSLANRARICRSTGIERSAHSVRRRPSSASAMSLTSWAAFFVATVISSPVLAARAGGAGKPMSSLMKLGFAVGALPGETLDLARCSTLAGERALFGVAAEMAVRRGRAVDGVAQLERLDDGAGREVELLHHGLLDDRLGQRAGTARLDQDGHRLHDADGVGKLHLAAFRQPRRDDVLGETDRK